MSKGLRYLLVSLPTSISPVNDHDEALTALRAAVTTEYGNVSPFKIPEFKIGTLDALVRQADDLAKLSAACESVVGKVGDSLKTIWDGNEETFAQQKTVNDSQWLRYKLERAVLMPSLEPPESYLRSFQWNRVKYRSDKPLGDIFEALNKVLKRPHNLSSLYSLGLTEW